MSSKEVGTKIKRGNQTNPQNLADGSVCLYEGETVKVVYNFLKNPTDSKPVSHAGRETETDKLNQSQNLSSSPR